MTVTRLMSVIGIAVAAVVALAFPVGYYAVSLASAKQSLRIETAAAARAVEDVVRANPEMWEYQSMRLLELVSGPTISGDADERVVRDVAGKEIAHTAFRAPAPLIAAVVPLYDSGVRVGTVEGRRGIAPIVGGAALMAAAGFLLGLSVYIVYRTWPIRILGRTLGQLSSQKRKSETTLDAVGDGVVAVDSGGRIVLINRAAERLLGWPKEAAVGRPVEEVYVVRTESDPRAGRPGRRTILRSEDGVERTIEESRQPLEEDGGGQGCVIAFRDVTDRVRFEDERFRGRQAESIGLLAAGIAHDFNNFLTGTLGNLSLARIHAAGDAKVLARLQEAERATQRARDLAQKLLTFAKGGEGARTVFDPAAVASDAARFAARGTAVKVVVDADPALWRVEADPVQFSQVVNNLVLNSVQATAGTGSIAIRMTNGEFRDGEIAHVRPGRYVVVRVEDSGPGIPDDALPRIFEPYFTTKADGTGLGLATCYNIMKAHGGNIFAESTAGRGTVFTLYLPATDRVAAEGARSALPPSPAPTAHGRILVMDDEPLIRDLAREFLTHLGYEVRLCENGDQAVAEYAQAARRELPYDAAILDLTIPGGLGGQDAAREILARFPDARLIVSSGYANHPAITRPADHGFRCAVTKPYRVDELAQAVRSALEGDGAVRG